MDREAIREFLLENGADLVGFTGAEPFADWGAEFESRLKDGTLPGHYAGTLNPDPRHYVTEASSIVVIGVMYEGLSLVEDTGRGSIAGIAWSRKKERELSGLLAQHLVESGCQARDVTGIPVKAAAARAGLATQRKNSLAYFEPGGSAVRIGTVVTDLVLAPDPPADFDPCGACTLCLDACPTGALIAEHVIDVQRCLCYVLEHDSTLPAGSQQAMGNRIVGCETCQLVCPLNRDVPTRPLDEVPWLDLLSLAREAVERPDGLVSLLRDELSLPVYSDYTPLRAVSIALGNWGDPAAIPHLEALAESDHPEVARAARWSLQRVRVTGA